jgi:hypothetical protein
MKIGLLPGAHQIGLLPDALDPGFHCVRTHWIQAFMALQLARHARTVMLMMPACPSLDCCDRES